MFGSAEASCCHRHSHTKCMYYVVKTLSHLVQRIKCYDYGNVCCFIEFIDIYAKLLMSEGVITIHFSSLTEIQVVFCLITAIYP